MNILFVHQNFPGQYVHIARALARQGGHHLVALGLKPRSANCPEGVQYHQYRLSRGNAKGVHWLASETEAKVIRAEACAQAAHQLKSQGFRPDLICAHPGWGEALFLPDVWPEVPLLAYQEFFYHPRGLDTDFDPELQEEKGLAGLRQGADEKCLSESHAAGGRMECFAHSVSTQHLPACAQQRMSTIHDGIDVALAAPQLSPASSPWPMASAFRRGADRHVCEPLP